MGFDCDCRFSLQFQLKDPTSTLSVIQQSEFMTFPLLSLPFRTATDTEMMNELWKTFVTQSHGLKGEAWGIGARTLGDFFYQLECAGKEKNIEKIEHFYPKAMEEWQQVVDAIQRVL